MINLLTDNEKYIALINGQPSMPKQTLSLGKHSVTLLPYNGEQSLLPICATITIGLENKVSCDIPLLEINSNTFELLPNFSPYYVNRPPTILEQTQYAEHTCTVYRDSFYHINIENGYSFIQLESQDEYISTNYIDLGNISMFICKFAKEIKLIACENGDYKILINRACSDMDFVQDGLLIKTKTYDMLHREIYEHFYFNGVDYICDNITYHYHIKHNYIPELIPFLFVESLIVKDYAYAKSLISEELSDVGEVHNFFGNIIGIYANKNFPYEVGKVPIVTQINDKFVLKIYKFALSDRKITDIDGLDN